MYRLVVVVCIVVIAVVVAVTQLQSAGVSRQADLVFNNVNEVNSLDPHRISWRHDIRIANALFEGLMVFQVDPPADGELTGEIRVVPAVAERFDYDPDSLTYTFHLRPAARWSNGQPVTTEDFVWSWQRMLSPVTAADYVEMLFTIKGARAYYDALKVGRPASFDDVGVKAVDAHTLVVTLEGPTAYFLSLTAFPPFFPVYRSLLADFVQSDDPSKTQNGVAIYTEQWTRPENLVCNGPYILTEHLFKSRIVLEKNRHYWGRDKIRLNRIIALAVSDIGSSFRAYESGICDMIDGVPNAAGRAIMSMPPERRPAGFVGVPSLGTYYYRFNCTAEASGKPNPFADPRVRRALAMCVDKDDIVSNVTGLRQQVANSFVPPFLSVPGSDGRTVQYTPPAGLTHDVSAAKALLAEAGHDGASLGEVRLMFNSSMDHRPIAERLAAIWEEQLGLNVQLVAKEGKAFGADLKSKTGKNWHLARGGWFADYQDPSTFLGMFQSDSGNNDSGYSNAEVDRLLAAATKTADQQRRMELFAQAERIIIEQDAVVIPLYHYLDQFMVRPNLKGAWPNIMGTTMLRQMWVED